MLSAKVVKSSGVYHGGDFNPSLRLTIIVKCPYCSKLHQHCLSGNEVHSEEVVYRGSDCIGNDYEISTIKLRDKYNKPE